MNGKFIRIISAILLCATFVLGFTLLSKNGNREKRVDANVVINTTKTTVATTKESTTKPLETTTEPTTLYVPPTTTTTTSAPVNVGVEYEVLEAVNRERANVGLSPLAMSETLCSAAKLRANEIVSVFSHQRPDGSSCFTAFNISYTAAGENIAAGQRTVDAVMTAWMNSEGHRANILSSNFNTFACAMVYDETAPYGYYWVQLFARV